MSARKTGVIVAVGVMAVFAVFAIYSATSSTRDNDPVGMVQHVRLRIAPEVTGRLSKVLVAPGQDVRKGDTLAVLDNPELAASLVEAKAAAASAVAERDRVFSGVRPEEVDIAEHAVETAQANLTLAEQTFGRARALSAQGFASRQRLDEGAAQVDKARADLDSRKAQHAAATAGPTSEERALADARVAVAAATVRDLQARLDKTSLVAPHDGRVGTLVSAVGEVLPAGRPVLTLDLNQDIYFSFSIREDRLNGLDVGVARDLVDAQGRRIPSKVSEIRPLGEFATWRASRAVGDHDRNSFRVRLEPLAPVNDLHAGMTVWLNSEAGALSR